MIQADLALAFPLGMADAEVYPTAAPRASALGRLLADARRRCEGRGGSVRRDER